MYVVVSNSDGEVVSHDGRATISKNLDLIKKEFCDHALELLRCGDEWVKSPPAIMRMSDMTVMCSLAVVIPEYQRLYFEFTTKYMHLQDQLTQLKVEFDKRIDNIVANMMNEDVTATQTPACYGIVQICDGEFGLVGTNRRIGFNTLEYYKKEYSDLAPQWLRLAVKEYDPFVLDDWTKTPPVVMRLSDENILYSVMDYMPEARAEYDKFVAKSKRVEECVIQLKAEYDANIASIVQGLVASSFP